MLKVLAKQLSRLNNIDWQKDRTNRIVFNLKNCVFIGVDT